MNNLRILIFAFIGILVSAVPVVAEEFEATVNASFLPVYARMTTDSNIVSSLDDGNAVIVEWVHEDMESKWCGIRLLGKAYTLGYVECKFLRAEDKRHARELQGTQKKQSTRSTGIRPYSDVTVMMYATSWCGYCKKARKLLRGMGVNLVEFDIERNKARAREMRSKGGRGVPFIDVEGIYIPGFSAEEIKQAVEKRRKGI